MSIAGRVESTRYWRRANGGVFDWSECAMLDRLSMKENLLILWVALCPGKGHCRAKLQVWAVPAAHDVLRNEDRSRHAKIRAIYNELLISNGWALATVYFLELRQGDFNGVTRQAHRDVDWQGKEANAGHRKEAAKLPSQGALHLAVFENKFELLDDLREVICSRYLADIQRAMRDERQHPERSFTGPPSP